MPRLRPRPRAAVDRRDELLPLRGGAVSVARLSRLRGMRRGQVDGRARGAVALCRGAHAKSNGAADTIADSQPDATPDAQPDRRADGGTDCGTHHNANGGADVHADTGTDTQANRGADTRAGPGATGSGD